MEDVLDIGEVARRTGLTLRGLRFYEARGLVQPLRTQSGRRIYGPGELARLHAVVALKRAGFSLAQIGGLLGGRRVDLAALITAQIAALDARVAEVAASRALLQSVLSRIDRREPLDVATLCSLIRSGETSMDRENWKQAAQDLFTPEERLNWREAIDQVPGGKSALLARVEALKMKISAQLPLDPASREAQALLDEWLAMTRPIANATTPEMRASAIRVAKEMGWEGDGRLPVDAAVWDFIKAAGRVRKASAPST